MQDIDAVHELLVEPIFRWQGKSPVYLEVVPVAGASPR